MMSARYEPIPKEDTYRLIALAQAGDEEAKELLMVQNAGLVRKLAHKFSSPEFEFEDFVQIGYVGLLKAVYRFDPEYNVMFSTYAVPIILGEMKQFFRDNGRIKAGRVLKTEVYNLKKIREEHLARTGQEMRIGEIARAMGISAEHVVEILSAENALTNVVSLDNSEGSPGEREVPDERFSETAIDAMAVRMEIEKLPERQRTVMGLRYYRDMTQTEISKLLGISQVQVSRIEKQAIENIRQCFRFEQNVENI